MFSSFSPMGGTHGLMQKGTCLSHYCRKAIRQSRVALAWSTLLARSERQPLLAITSGGPWLSAACYQLLPWPRRLDLSISQCLLFCNSKKKDSSWLILGSFSCVVSLSVSLTIQLKFHSTQAGVAGQRGRKGPSGGDFWRAGTGATSDQEDPIWKFLRLHKSGLACASHLT